MSISPALRRPANGSPGPERRSHPRTNVMDRRLITVNLDNRDAGLLVDLSESGLAVQALARIKPGATTALQFELPETGKRIDATGFVAWSDSTSGRAGIHFENLSETASAAVKAWLERPNEPAKAATTLPVPSALGPQSNVAEIATLQREIVNQALDREQALALIALRTRTLTRAAGAAIVLGDAKLMTCKASSGSAPPVGTELRPDSGLSGECVRTGVTIRCEDTELDPRVDPEVCRQIGLRSAVIVPLFARGNISGLVETFYAAPRAFDGRDVLTQRRVADLISATLARATGTPIVSSAPLERGDAGGKSAPANGSVPSAACDVCGHQNPPGTVDCEKCDVPLPGSIRESETRTSAAAVAPSTPLVPPVAVRAAEFRTSPAEVRDTRAVTLRVRARPLLLIAVAGLLVVAGLFGWREFRRRQWISHTPAISSPDLPPVVQAAAPVAAADSISFESAPASKPSPGTALASRVSATPAEDAVSRAPSVRLPEVISPDVTVRVPTAIPRTQAGAPAEVPAPSLRMPAANPVVAMILEPPAVAPILNSRISPPATISPARLLRRVEPVYPTLAITNRVQGTVVLKATILRNGRLGNVGLVSGNGLLAGAAMTALQQWRYKPQELDGKAVDADTTITLKFSLGKDTR